MPAVFVFCEPTQEQVVEDIKSDLLWYDIETQKMLTLKGSALRYEYSYDPGVDDFRLQPRAEQIQKTFVSTVFKTETIKNWFEGFSSDRMHIKASLTDENSCEGWVEFDVPQNEMEEFVVELVENGFDYQVNR